MSYTCPFCGKTSFNPNDERERYCGNCHEYEADHRARLDMVGPISVSGTVEFPIETADAERAIELLSRQEDEAMKPVYEAEGED